MRDLIVEFYIPRVDESKSEGKHILQMICDLLPEVKPEFYNAYEPVNKKFDEAHPEAALKEWHFSFLWKRKKPSVTGIMFLGSVQPKRPTHTHLIIRAKPEILDTPRLICFLEEFSKAFLVDFGLVHILTKPEIERKTYFGLSTFMLRESLPNLYWATVFGAPYVKLFGREWLLSTPAALVKELAGNLVYIQLTDDLMDNRTKPEHVEIARQKAKTQTGLSSILKKGRPSLHLENAPQGHSTKPSHLWLGNRSQPVPKSRQGQQN
jgi:hypothetical protein